jgi:hypothetical protein
MSKNISKTSLENQFIARIQQLERIVEEMRNTDQMFFMAPKLSSDPTNLTEGMIWYNTTSHTLKLRKNGTTVTITTS